MIASTQINTEFINIKDNMTLPLIKTNQSVGSFHLKVFANDLC